MTLLVLLVAITLSPILTEADIAPIPVRPPTVQQLIVKYAIIYAAPEKELIQTAKCESFFNPAAVGDQGAAVGVFQFHKPTFDRYAKLLGETLDYHSTNDQAKLAAFMFGTIPSTKSQWTCWSHNFGHY